MATRVEKSSGLMFDRGGPKAPAVMKPKPYEELGLCLALVLMVSWALYTGLHAVDWPAVSHTIKVILAAI